MVWGDDRSVERLRYAEAGQQDCSTSLKHVWCADDRLTHMMQTERERSRNIIRKQQVCDPSAGEGVQAAGPPCAGPPRRRRPPPLLILRGQRESQAPGHRVG